MHAFNVSVNKRIKTIPNEVNCKSYVDEFVLIKYKVIRTFLRTIPKNYVAKWK